ncbi:MAG: hypothetical protein ACPH5K_04355 [Polaribacter sp.]
MIRKRIALFFAVLTSSILLSQDLEVPKKQTQLGFGKIDYLSIEMPGNEANMGFTGIHYNIMATNWGAYAGVGIYGAISGIRGGFFTLGVNAGIKEYLSDRFFTDLGFHFGGGGGAGAPDGGGAFILPHVNLGYDFKDFSVQAGWSYVNFFDGGAIKGNQFNVGIEVPMNFDHASYEDREKEFSTTAMKSSGWNQKTKQTSLLFHLNNLKVQGNTQPSSYQGRTIRLAGFELAQFFTDNWFGFVKVDGAYHGIKAGYMDVFLGGGYRYSFNQNRTNLLAKFAVGAGGGGGIDTKGGFLIQPDISIEQKVFGDFFLALNKGYVINPDRSVNTSSYGFGLKYYVERNGTYSENASFDNIIFKGVELIVKHDLYLDATRDSNPTEDLHQISLQVNLDISKHLYAAGQTSFATLGNAGAYAEGIVGLGLRSNSFIKSSTRLFAQVLGGAAGGGNISTGEGFIVKPSVGITTKLSDKLNLRAAGGYVKASGGNLSSTLLNVGLSYNISVAKSCNRLEN